MKSNPRPPMDPTQESSRRRHRSLANLRDFDTGHGTLQEQWTSGNNANYVMDHIRPNDVFKEAKKPRSPKPHVDTLEISTSALASLIVVPMSGARFSQIYY